jgi:hypothetical protein
VPSSILFDTGTLRNFAACNSLELLRRLCDGYQPPHWVEAVRAELERLSIHKEGPERTQCRYILSPTHGAWLGDPIEPSLDEQLQIFAIRTALASGVGGHPLEHLGEAQTIWVAGQLGATFATDDAPAFAYASGQLGPSHVFDTVEILRCGVAKGSVTADEASNLVARMRSADRILRRVHPTPLMPSEFR